MNWENLVKNRCPICGSKLDILICGRRVCYSKYCFFTMNETETERMIEKIKQTSQS